MVDEKLSRFLWKGLNLKRYEVVEIVPQNRTHAVIIMRHRDPNNPHWCLEYLGNGHYFDPVEQLVDYWHERKFKNLPSDIH